MSVQVRADECVNHVGRKISFTFDRYKEDSEIVVEYLHHVNLPNFAESHVYLYTDENQFLPEGVLPNDVGAYGVWPDTLITIFD